MKLFIDKKSFGSNGGGYAKLIFLSKVTKQNIHINKMTKSFAVNVNLSLLLFFTCGTVLISFKFSSFMSGECPEEHPSIPDIVLGF